ncbi:MAG: glutamate-cysteine ligase family protein, partial [bacterium]|nr:glutamate-cysteine ligase family protein [bacterium]
RDGKYINVAGASFKDFIKNGLMGCTATVGDFMDHLSTVFTDVRLRPYLELRSADVGPSPMLRALPAFWKGILYSNLAKEKIFELMDNVKIEELKKLQFDVAKIGFDASFRGVSILSLAKKILTISKNGLIAQAEEINASIGEQQFLLPLFDIVAKKQTYAQKLLELYRTKWNGDISNIYSTKPFVLGI